MRRTAQRRRCRAACPRAGRRPHGPGLPPRSADRRRLGQPLLGVGVGRLTRGDGHARVARGIDQALDVARRRQGELARAAHELGGGVAGLPGRQVVGTRPDHERVTLDLAEVDGLAVDRAGARGDRVLHEQIEEVGVQAGRQARGVGVPRQNVEGRGLLSHQVVAHPVIPDEVVGPQHGEERGGAVPAQHAGPLGGTHGVLDDGRAGQQADHGRDRVVQEGDGEGGAVDKRVLCGGEVTEKGGGGDATGAQRDRVGLVGAGYLAGGARGVIDRVHIGGQPPLAVLLGRIAPTDGEHLDALFQGEFHETPTRGEVHEVVLVDLRGHHDHREVMDRLGRRCVLQELAHLVAEDDGPGGDRQVTADHEGGTVNRAWEAAIGPQVPRDVAQALRQAAAARLEGALEGVRVEERHVGRRQRGGEKDRRQLGPLGRAPVELRVLHQIERHARPGQVGLAQAVKEGVLLPGPIFEAPVLRVGGDRRPSDRDLGQLDPEPGGAAGEAVGGGPCPYLHHRPGQAEGIDRGREPSVVPELSQAARMQTISAWSPLFFRTARRWGGGKTELRRQSTTPPRPKEQ